MFVILGPTENPGFHVSSGGAFQNQGAGVPAAGGQGSQPMRALQMHTSQSLPPQQVPHPQPPPTPTSTPPSSDMGKTAQSKYFISFLVVY